MGLKILLANPSYKKDLDGRYEKYFIRSGSRWPHSGIKRKGSLPHYLPFPFSLAYAAAWLKKEGFYVDVLDCIALDMDQEGFLAHIKNEKPDITFFETTTPTIKYDLMLVNKIKKLGETKIVLGGTHSTAFSRELLAENPQIDWIVRNEYEETLLNLLKCIQVNGSIQNVKGLSFMENGRLVETETAPLIYPLDKLPPPAREMFPSQRKPGPAIYWDGFCQMKPAIQMHGSRGCPYRCDFCLWNQVMFRNGKYRTFSAKRIVDEMEHAAQNYGAKEIYFDDDDFMVDTNHVREICAEIKQRNLNVKWSVMGDAINPSEELIKTMAESGCIGIKFGIETASTRLLQNLGKPIDLEKAKLITLWCAKYRIKTHSTFTLGLYGEDMQSIKETLSFVKGFKTDTIQVSICTPFPGTRFFEKAKKENLIKTAVWEKFDGKVSDVISYTGIDLVLIENLRQEIIKKWLFSRIISLEWLLRQAHYLFRTLKGIGLKFAIKQAYSIIVDEFMISKWKKSGT